MSKVIAGQLRLMEESSRTNASHMGMNFDAGKNPGAPVIKEQSQPNLKKDASLRGKMFNFSKKNNNPATLRGNSTFTEPFAHFSVGFNHIVEDPKDLNKTLEMRDRGRSIIHPRRMGKKDESGMALPAKKEQAPPQKKSTVLKKDKTTLKDKVMTGLKKVGKPFEDLENEMKQELN